MIMNPENLEKATQHIRKSCPFCVFTSDSESKVKAHLVVHHTDKEVEEELQARVNWMKQYAEEYSGEKKLEIPTSKELNKFFGEKDDKKV